MKVQLWNALIKLFCKRTLDKLFWSSKQDADRQNTRHRRIWNWRPWYYFFAPLFTSRKDDRLFFTGIFAMLAKLCQSDGMTTSAEVYAIDRFIAIELGLEQSQKIHALNIFNRARRSSTSFEKYARHYYNLFKNEMYMLENAVDVLLKVACCDGKLSKAEERLIKHAVNLFGISSASYRRMKHVNLAGGRFVEGRVNNGRSRTYENNNLAGNDFNLDPQLAGVYNILGAQPTDSKDVIKSKYRKLVLRYHPDRQRARGIPEEMLKVFREKFIQIQEAYELLESRGKA